MLQESPKDVPSKASELVKSKVTEDIDVLRDRKAEFLVANGKKNTYIKDRIDKYAPSWFKDYAEMRKSGDEKDRRLAFVEFNKLQARVLPTQFEGNVKNDLVVNIIGMGVEKPPTDYVDGEIAN